MTNKIEFWQLQKRAALSNQECADYLDVTKRSIERWRVGKPEAPKAVILAMELKISQLDKHKQKKND